MLPPRIPGQIADRAMILMSVGAVMAENQVRADFLLYFLEEFLDLRSLVGKESVAEILDHHFLTFGLFQKERSGGTRFQLAHPPGTEYHPIDIQVGVVRQQPQHGAPAADLD